MLGNADDIVMHLCERLGWQLPPRVTQTLMQKQIPVTTSTSSRDDGGNLFDPKKPSDDGQLKKIRPPQRVGER